MPRVLVVGAGIAGLSLAMGLRTRGVSATVVEQAPEIADAGLSIALREPHFQALTEIGYPDSRSWRHFPIRQVMHYDDKGAPVEAGPEGCMFTRGDLQHAMLAPVRDLVRTGIKPVAMDDRGDDVLVRFNDNTEDVFDVVIGADGVNSWVRRTVLGGPAAEYTGCAVTRFRVPNVDRIDTGGSLPGAGLALGFGPLPGGERFHTYFFLRGPADNRRDATLSELAELFGDVAEPARSVLAGAKANPDSYYVNVHQVNTDTWARNRVAIIGDAAHAMSPALGQGAYQGVVDAQRLADLLSTVPIADALVSYEQERKTVVQVMQRASLVMQEQITAYDPAVRNAPFMPRVAQLLASKP